MTRDELIAANPHLIPLGSEKARNQNDLVLAAKNLRTELKTAGIVASVRTTRYANGNSMHVSVLDESDRDRAQTLADRYCNSTFDSYTDTTKSAPTEWTRTFGGARNTSAGVACGEEREKLLGTYKAPAKESVSLQEIEAKFLTGAERGTESTLARYVPHFKDDPDIMLKAWDRLTMTLAQGKGDPNALAVLVEAGMDPNTRIRVRPATSALLLALGGNTQLSERRPATVATLLEHGAEPKSEALVRAARNGDTRIAEVLLAHGADINANAGVGDSPLHDAVFKKHYVMVNFLLDKGADPNQRNERGETPLHMAFNVMIAEVLLDRGADPTIKCAKGTTADEKLAYNGMPSLPEDVRALIRQHRLNNLAQASRPQSDLATPEEALARRQARGRAM